MQRAALVYQNLSREDEGRVHQHKLPESGHCPLVHVDILLDVVMVHVRREVAVIRCCHAVVSLVVGCVHWPESSTTVLLCC